MFKQILTCVDSSQYTPSVLETAIFLAKNFDAKISVLHVIDIRLYEWSVSFGMDGFTSVMPSASFQEESRELMERRGEEILAKVRTKLESAGVSFELIKDYGAPPDVIVEKSRLSDMVILGMRGEMASWSGKFLGSVTERVTRELERPILLTQKEFIVPKKILIAYDGSDHSSKALKGASFIAEKLRVPIVLLTVHTDRLIAEEIQAEAMTYIRNFSVLVEEIIVEGKPEEKIIETAAESGSNFIAMGGYGHSRIREAILGSTTIQVMRKSQWPILMYK